MPIPSAVLLALALQANPPASPCAGVEFHQFDFWIGEWDVSTPDGKPAGSNRIEALHGGCVLNEHWEGAQGGQGSSLNAWDARTGRWRQFWADRSGGVLQLEGGWDGTSMVLTGSHPGADGAAQVQRITWTPNADGSVRQHWEQSTDGGQQWTSAFDGHYVRRQAKR